MAVLPKLPYLQRRVVAFAAALTPESRPLREIQKQAETDWKKYKTPVDWMYLCRLGIASVTWENEEPLLKRGPRWDQWHRESPDAAKYYADAIERLEPDQIVIEVLESAPMSEKRLQALSEPYRSFFADRARLKGKKSLSFSERLKKMTEKGAGANDTSSKARAGVRFNDHRPSGHGPHTAKIIPLVPKSPRRGSESTPDSPR